MIWKDGVSFAGRRAVFGSLAARRLCEMILIDFLNFSMILTTTKQVRAHATGHSVAVGAPVVAVVAEGVMSK